MARSCSRTREARRSTARACGASVASFVLSLDDGREVDTLAVGQEGAVAGIVNQDRLPAYSRIIVQRGGKFVTLEATKLEAAKQRSLAMRGLFARYADGLIAQLLQSIACNAAHSIEQRTARWIAAAIERTGEDILPMNGPAVLPEGGRFLPKPYSPTQLAATLREITADR